MIPKNVSLNKILATLNIVKPKFSFRMQDNVERIVLCNAVVFHKTQISYVLTSPILQQLQDLGNKLKQPDPSVASLLTALVFLQGILIFYIKISYFSSFIFFSFCALSRSTTTINKRVIL